MPIRLFCSACGETMQNIRTADDVSAFSGKELCDDCLQKLQKIKAEIDKVHDLVLRKLDILYKTAQKDLANLMSKSQRKL